MKYKQQNNNDMRISEHYISVIEEAIKIAQGSINVESVMNGISETATLLKNRIIKDTFVKIPVVGDFSAGKSTLLNHSIIGRKILPTDINPTTAVSYELWFADQEKLEVWKDGKLNDTVNVSEIENLQVGPGDIVKVFLNNEKIKRLNDNGIVVVDMPGIGSGIEAHNNAILNYLKEGTFFIIAVDVEQGTLCSSTIAFINEIKNYGLSAAVLVTKSDKKTLEEAEKVKTDIGQLAKKLIGAETFVGLTSSSSEQYEDVEKILFSKDGEELLTQKYASLINTFVDSIIFELKKQETLLVNGKRDYIKEIEELKERKEDALQALKRNNDSAQPLEESAGDILYDIENALKGKATQLAMTLIQNKDDLEIFKAEMLSTIRPVLINSYKREISEYQDIMDNSLRDFTFDISGVLPDNSLDDVFDNEELQNAAHTVLSTVLAFFEVPPILADLIADKLIGHLPDFLKSVFGKGKNEVISEIRTNLCANVFPQVTNTLRPEIEKVLGEQRQAALEEIKQRIIDEAQKFDDSISVVQKEQSDSEDIIRAKTELLKQSIEKLSSLKI